MCDHCSKVTSQKGYGGQVTCKCEHGAKRDEEAKDVGGCCSKKAREAAGGCCMSGCCKESKNGKDKNSAGCGMEMKKNNGSCCAGNNKK